MAELNLTINGESQTTTKDNLTALLAELGLGEKLVAVELNGGVVPRAEHGKTTLSSGDVLEIVHFVGGG